MKTLFLLVAVALAFPIEEIFRDRQQNNWAKFENRVKRSSDHEGFLSIFQGYLHGIGQAAKDDVMSFPECVFGFPCAYTVLEEFVVFVREMKPFDIKKFFEKAYSLLFMGMFGCLQSCMIPATYFVHFQPLFNGITLEAIKEVLMYGVLLNVLVIYYNGMDAFTDFMQGNYRNSQNSKPLNIS